MHIIINFLKWGVFNNGTIMKTWLGLMGTIKGWPKLRGALTTCRLQMYLKGMITETEKEDLKFYNRCITSPDRSYGLWQRLWQILMTIQEGRMNEYFHLPVSCQWHYWLNETGSQRDPWWSPWRLLHMAQRILQHNKWILSGQQEISRHANQIPRIYNRDLK